jgi:hypothetical protein
MWHKVKAWLPRLALVLAVVVIAWSLGRSLWMYLEYNWKTVSFPYSVDYGEGPVLDQVMRMSKFQNIYLPNPTQIPYTISNYPPLYHLVQTPFAWIFGPAYWYGRGISFLSILAAAVFIVLTLQAITKDWLASVIGGVTLLAIPYILHWSPFCRVDSLALGVSWAGLFVIVRWPNNRKALITGAALLTAAIFTRQSYALTAPFAAFIWLVNQKPRLQAFKLAAWVVGMGLAAFLVLMLLSKGGFYFNIITSNVNQFYWNTVKDYAKAIWEHMSYLVITSSLFIMLAAFFRVYSWWLATPYLLAATASAVTVGKAGSNVNYLFEFSAGLAFMAGAILAVAGKIWWAKAILVLLLAVQVAHIYPWTKDNYYQWVMGRVEDERGAIGVLQDYVHEAQSPVLADEFMGLVVLDHRQLVFQPFEFKQLSLANLWDETPFIHDLNAKKFDLILLYAPVSWDSRHERWTQDQLDAIGRNYKMVDIQAQTIVLKPEK